MKKKADAHAYEDAQKIRDTIRALESLRDRQIVRDAFPGNYDIIVILEKYDKVFTSLTQIRNGLVISMERYALESTIGDEPCELIESFIAREYSEKNNETDPITLLMKEHALGEAIMELLKGRSILVEFPKIGPKAEAIRFAEINLLNYAFQESMKELSRKTISRSTCVSLLSKLGYIAPARGPIVFECFDISHTDGNYTVASKSVIMNGKPSPALYRKYKIRSIPDQQIDDFASIAEVIQRRSTEMREENNAPTFILIDGGKGQLSAALEKLTEAHLDRPPFLASIAKREEEIFVPGNPKSIRLEAGSPELILLQRIRDEAHRFAIGYGKTLRSKAMKKNILEELP